MKIIAFISQKGGVGKTTICSNMAVIAAQKGYKTIIMDDDPQGSLAEWWNKRQDDKLDYLCIEPKDLKNACTELVKEKIDYLFIDTPGALSNTLKHIIPLCDYVLVPTQPRTKDFMALERTIEILNDAGAPYSFIISRVDRRSNQWMKAVKGLSHISTIAGIISENTAYEKADETSQGITEYAPKTSNSKEMLEIWENLQNYLKKEAKRVA